MNLDDLPENDIGEPICNSEEETQPEPEDKEDKFKKIIKEQGLKNKILRYKVSFAKYLESYNYRIQELDALNIEQLETLLQEIEICVSCRTSGNMLGDYYISTVSVIERCAPLVSMNLSGLSEILGKDERIRECLDEISIKYDVLSYTPPEARLAYLTLRAIMAINQVNKKKEKTAAVLNERVKPEVINAYADL